MYPYISIFGHEMTGYALCSAAGVIACLIFLELETRKRANLKLKAEAAFLAMFVGVLIGSKLLYIATVLPSFIDDLPALFSDPKAFAGAYLQGGFVFYGGLFGGLAGVLIYCKATHTQVEPMIRLLVPTAPLFHIFGRVGCLLEGCCYGAQAPQGAWYAITFENSLFAPNGVGLYPTQVIEIVGELALFAAVLLLSRKGWGGYRLLATYFISYGVLRFADEFLRGDAARGFLGPLSTSQWISIVAVALGVYLLGRQRSRQHNSLE